MKSPQTQQKLPLSPAILCIAWATGCLTTAAQTFDLNVACPIVESLEVPEINGLLGNSHNSLREPEQDGNCECQPGTVIANRPRLITPQEMLADQNRVLDQRFSKVADDHTAILAELASNHSATDSSLMDLNATLQRLAVANREALEKMAHQAAERDREILHEVRSSSESVADFSKELVKVAEQSVQNTQAMIKLIEDTDDKLKSFQQQVRDSFQAFERQTDKSDAMLEKIARHQAQTRSLLAALDKDLEQVRQRMTRLNGEQSKSRKQLLERLKGIEEIKKRLDQQEKDAKSDQRKPRNRKQAK